MKNVYYTALITAALLLSGCGSSSSSSSTQVDGEFDSSSSSSSQIVIASSSSANSSSLSSMSSSIHSSSSSVATQAKERIEVVACSAVSDDAYTPIQAGDSLHNEELNTTVEIIHNDDDTKSVCTTSGSAYLLRG